MSGASLGPHVGLGYVSGLGTVEVFATDRTEFFRVQTKRGHRHFVTRESVQFRKRKASA